MDSWIILFLTISIAISLKLLLSKLTSSSSSTKTLSLPPGPPAIPFVIKNALRRTSLFELELVLRRLHAKYGPIICLRVPFHPTVFIADRNLAHEALIQRGLVFADRPPIVGGARKLVTGYSDINNSSYGPLWRVLRRNLASEILLPQRIKLFGPGRKWALGLLLDRLRLQSETGDSVDVMDSFQLTMLSLLVLICFGEKVNEKEIQEIQSLQLYFLRLFVKFNPFAFLPSITKHVFRKKWEEIVEAVRRQEGIFVPMIKLRRQRIGRGGEFAYSYVDSLIDVELEGGRKLRDEEISNLCHEFMSAGTDTTSTAMEWIVAELVRNREVQGKLRREVDEVAKDRDEIGEEDLERMSYLKAVITEGLRRHPPGHFLLPHKATEDAVVGGYLVPKGAEVHVNVVEAGWDGVVWEEPMEFRPERFLGREVVDMTGSREIVMMPFGVGRRMCPGYRLALLHLEYFVANLVREFEWDAAVEGEEVDLSEILRFTTVMKNPLRARIRSRRK